MDWINLSVHRDTWWALVTTVMNPGVPYNKVNFLTMCMELVGWLVG
jgi:uncharacterized membrane protein YdjX (TVP38/TMEM64 family)